MSRRMLKASCATTTSVDDTPAAPTLPVPSLDDAADVIASVHVPEEEEDFMLMSLGGDEQFYCYRGRSMSIGRKAACDIVLNDERVSVLHCTLYRSSTADSGGGHVVLEDHSSNGTYLNKHCLAKRRKAKLCSGDEIGIVLTKRHRDGASFVRLYLFHDPKTLCSIARFPSQQPVRHWQIGREIGRGAHGLVSLGMNTDTGELIAVKVVHKTRTPSSSPALSAAAERALLSEIRHPHVVQYLGFNETDDDFYLFLEYVSGGSLQQLLATFGVFDETVVQLYTMQMLQGLRFLHQRDIIHGDIKSANILITHRGQIKLSDFGTSRVLGPGQTNTVAGTPLWMSPEMIRTSTSSKASDEWALGCVVLEMASGLLPWAERQFDNVTSLFFYIGNATSGPSLDGLAGASPNLRDFVLHCFAIDPAERWTVAELLRHPFLHESRHPSDPSSRIQRTPSTMSQHLAFIEKQSRRPGSSSQTAAGITAEMRELGLESPRPRPTQPRPADGVS